MPTREVLIWTCEACGVEEMTPIGPRSNVRPGEDPNPQETPDGWSYADVRFLRTDDDHAATLACPLCTKKVMEVLHPLREAPESSRSYQVTSR